MGLFGFFRRKKKKIALDTLRQRRDDAVKTLKEYRSEWKPGFVSKNTTLPEGYREASDEAFSYISRAYEIVSCVSVTKTAQAYLSQLEDELRRLEGYYYDASGKSVVLGITKGICEIAEKWMYDQK